jgi:hypothetical protein
MGPKADVEALDLCPQRELSHADAVVMAAALGSTFSVRVAIKVQPNAGKKLQIVFQRAGSNSKAIADRFAALDVETKALYFSTSSILSLPMPTFKSLSTVQKSGKINFIQMRGLSDEPNI